MSSEYAIEALINPLFFTGIDQPIPPDRSVNIESVIEYLCRPDQDISVKTLSQRYISISSGEDRLFIVPNEERILNKLIWPLKNAKASYMLGNYLGTISLCGMVSEMISILLFDISDFTINKSPLDDSLQQKIWGSTFEKLGQYRRVEILYAYNIINSELKVKFDLVRTTRKKYLHLWSQDFDNLPKDAIEVYHASISIVVKILGQNIENGKIILNPKIIKYLQQKGIYKPVDY